MKTLQLLTLSILSGILLVGAWPLSPLTPLIFIAFIPLLIIGQQAAKRTHFFYGCLLAMLIWNAGTTWWIWNSTIPGAIGAIVANSFLMCVPLLGYYNIQKKFGSRMGLLSLVAFWLSFEYIHLNWQLSWPWLTLGNVFATKPEWVQWYEYTGTSGGSLWILLVNVLLFNMNSKWRSEQRRWRTRTAIAAAVILLIPFSFSYAISRAISSRKLKETTANVIIVQPNVDPYTEKFEEGGTAAQVAKLIKLSETKLDSNTRLVIWPETALPMPVWLHEFEQSTDYQPVFDFVKRHPNITLQTGVETIKNYGAEKATITARRNWNNNTYYDAFNTAVAITNNKPMQFYNKSKLVPGVETLPTFLMWMSRIFEQFGGTAGGYGIDKEANVFSVNKSTFITAPIICYESIYGEYVASYVRKGANLLTIMTNDGWWANTPGHRQHLNYARLRALETRKWVARSANTGISAVINPIGNILETRQWEQTGFIKFNIPAVTGETFFVAHGDVISPVAIFIMIALLLYSIFEFYKKRRIRK